MEGGETGDLLVVVQEAVGSNPISHPIFQQVTRYLGVPKIIFPGSVPPSVPTAGTDPGKKKPRRSGAQA